MMHLTHKQRLGIANTILASFLLGWAPILGKLAYASGATAYTVVAIRTLVAASLLWIVFLLFWRKDIAVSWHGLLGCIGVGAVNGFGSLLYYTSLVRLDASLASLLNTLYPLWVVLFLFASGQPLTRLTIARLGLSMLGVYLLTFTSPGEMDWMGVVLMVASAMLYGWHLVLGQWVLADVSSRTGALYILTTMACIVGAARIVEGRPLEPLAVTGWTAIVSLGLTTALSRLAMFSALERLGGIETSLAGLLELLVSLLLALALLGERLTIIQWLGGGLLVLSLWMMAKDPGMRLAEGNVPLEWRRKK